MLVFLIVLGTTIWVGYDAHLHKIPITNKPYSANNGVVAWVLSCLLLWIASFPYYLYKRSKALKKQ